MPSLRSGSSSSLSTCWTVPSALWRTCTASWETSRLASTRWCPRSPRTTPPSWTLWRIFATFASRTTSSPTSCSPRRTLWFSSRSTASTSTAPMLPDATYRTISRRSRCLGRWCTRRCSRRRRTSFPCSSLPSIPSSRTSRNSTDLSATSAATSGPTLLSASRASPLRPTPTWTSTPRRWPSSPRTSSPITRRRSSSTFSSPSTLKLARQTMRSSTSSPSGTSRPCSLPSTRTGRQLAGPASTLRPLRTRTRRSSSSFVPRAPSTPPPRDGRCSRTSLTRSRPWASSCPSSTTFTRTPCAPVTGPPSLACATSRSWILPTRSSP
mmetsp:Transcript_18952/g.38947  ORF Transcript_18952/g.38947 Transcript_18952/m.38947 type:complete len:324 (-) Transcript_18952:1267-2238(-)